MVKGAQEREGGRTRGRGRGVGKRDSDRGSCVETEKKAREIRADDIFIVGSMKIKQL